MKKALVGLLLLCLSGTVNAANKTDEQIGSWHIVDKSNAFTPALNTNSSILGLSFKEEKIYITLMSDFNECKSILAEGQLLNRSLQFRENVQIDGMVQCRQGKSKTDVWFPKGTTNSLLLNALLIGDRYLIVGSTVFSSEGYSQLVNKLSGLYK